MNIEKVEQAACECMASRQESKDREPGWLYHHGRRVARIALRLADEIGAAVDRDVMYAGALFHDIGKGAEPHNEIGAAITREALYRVYVRRVNSMPSAISSRTIIKGSCRTSSAKR